MKLEFNKAVTMAKDNIEVIRCIQELDGAAEQIYITDVKGNYTGVAVTRESFRNAFGNGDFTIAVPSVEYESVRGGAVFRLPRQ